MREQNSPRAHKPHSRHLCCTDRTRGAGGASPWTEGLGGLDSRIQALLLSLDFRLYTTLDYRPLTPDLRIQSMKFKLKKIDFILQTLDFKLQTLDCILWLWTLDYRQLQTVDLSPQTLESTVQSVKSRLSALSFMVLSLDFRLQSLV